MVGAESTTVKEEQYLHYQCTHTNSIEAVSDLRFRIEHIPKHRLNFCYFL
jgi:hypothetical protein